MLGSLILYNKGMRIIMFPTFWLLLYNQNTSSKKSSNHNDDTNNYSEP